MDDVDAERRVRALIPEVYRFLSSDEATPRAIAVLEEGLRLSLARAQDAARTPAETEA